MPKTGMKIATIEKTSEAIPKASIVLLIVWLGNMMKFVKGRNKTLHGGITIKQNQVVIKDYDKSNILSNLYFFIELLRLSFR